MKVIGVLLVLAAVGFAGCTGSGDQYVTIDEVEKDEFGNVVIKMTGALTFEPKYLEVPANTNIVFENVGGGIHDAEAKSGVFKTPLIESGEKSGAITLVQEGEIEYHCNPHLSNGMKGYIRVVAE